MTEICTGIVLWFRPTSGQGMVRGADGRQFFFRAAEAEGIQPEAGLNVRFTLSAPERGPVEAVGLQLAGEKRVVSLPAGARPTRASNQRASGRICTTMMPATNATTTARKAGQY